MLVRTLTAFSAQRFCSASDMYTNNKQDRKGRQRYHDAKSLVKLEPKPNTKRRHHRCKVL